MEIFIIVIVVVFLGLFALMSLPLNANIEASLNDPTETKLPEA